MSGKKQFLLGVGCHKGGTSWLWDYLNSHPDCRMPGVKELHVFDNYFLPEKFGQFHLRRLEVLNQILQEDVPIEEKAINDEIYHLMSYLLMQKDLRQYPIYMDLLGMGKKRRKLVGDITPSYCALREPHLKRIKHLMEAFGYHIKVVFLMRDPVDRVFSALRMFDRDNSHLGKAEATQRFDSEHNDWRRRVRTDYKATVEALESTFTPEDIFYGFYETLFNEDTVQDLTKFLGIRNMPANFNKRVNASPQQSSLSASQIKLARNTYDWVYEFCAEKFGTDFIRSIWKHY